MGLFFFFKKSLVWFNVTGVVFLLSKSFFSKAVVFFKGVDVFVFFSILSQIFYVFFVLFSKCSFSKGFVQRFFSSDFFQGFLQRVFFQTVFF